MVNDMSVHQNNMTIQNKQGSPRRRILLSPPHLSGNELTYIQQAFDANWVAPLGPNVDTFEAMLAKYNDISAVAAVVSGTAALHLALRLLNIGPGDTVFCSSFTFVASANPILYQGATPVFIDSDPESWCMSVKALKRAFDDAVKNNALPKAVIVANIYGQSADYDALIVMCNEYGVPIIEDAAESLGAMYKGRPSGTLGRLGVYSFNGNKMITTSGGGALVSNDVAMIEHARFLSTQARSPAAFYLHHELGYNYRLSNICAGIGIAQMEVLSERVSARREIFSRYQAGLADISAISWMPEPAYGQSSRWLSVLRLDPQQTSLRIPDLIAHLDACYIESRHVWNPLHQQPLFKAMGVKYFTHDDGVSYSDSLFDTCLCLPSGSSLTKQEQEYVMECLQELFE